MYDLACNPDVQQKLKEEVDSVMKQCNRELSLNVIQNMEYLDMVFQGETDFTSCVS